MASSKVDLMYACTHGTDFRPGLLQNKQGELASGNVASEGAALLEYCVLPHILKLLSSMNDPGMLAARIHEVAAAIHVPHGDVTWPAWISKDNASTFCHGWLRLMNPRITTEATKANLLPALRTFRDQCNPHPANTGAALIWRLHHSWLQQEYEGLRSWYSQHNQGADVADTELRDALTRDQGLLHYHQAMPLGPKMPECHSMIEHAIGTAKGHIKKQLDMITHDDPQLMGALWYQTKLQEAIATKLSGDAGRNHVRGSVQKWEFCVQVVAADADCQIHVKYPKNQYSSRGRGRPMHQNPDPNDRAMVDVMVSGTAGGYPPAWLC